MNEPTWTKVGGEGLYLHRNGTYHVRYRLRGKQNWKSLKTQVLTAARIKLREFMVGIERTRAAAAPERSLATLGDCDRVLREELIHSQQSERTKQNYRDQLDAVADNWPRGNYGATRPAAVTHDVLVELRSGLQEAKWKTHNTKRTKVGYSNAYTNQCLARLKNVLEIARLKGLCTADPFLQVSGLQGSVWLPLNTRKPNLPGKADMDRLFAEMRRVTSGPQEEPAFTQWRRDRAVEASEHARFLAYSGMRLQEANRMTWADVQEKHLRVEGFTKNKRGRDERQVKTVSSDRLVPIMPAMGALLTEIRAWLESAGLPVAGRILVPHTSMNAIKAACGRLGLKHLRHHDLRHYFATACIEAGTDIPTLSRWLGHSDGGVLCQKTYGHLRTEHSLAAAAKVTF